MERLYDEKIPAWVERCGVAEALGKPRVVVDFDLAAASIRVE